MSHAKRCPVCSGTGVVGNPNYPGNTAAIASLTVQCHGCYGVGWVVVPGAPPRTPGGS